MYRLDYLRISECGVNQQTIHHLSVISSVKYVKTYLVQFLLEGESQRESPTGSNASADIEALADAMQESPANSEHSSAGDIEKGDNSQLSSLELENRLLRNEIASLNQEMASLIQRAKDSQTGNKN